jgi:hypothetical protein
MSSCLLLIVPLCHIRLAPYPASSWQKHHIPIVSTQQGKQVLQIGNCNWCSAQISKNVNYEKYFKILKYKENFLKY